MYPKQQEDEHMSSDGLMLAVVHPVYWWCTMVVYRVDGLLVCWSDGLLVGYLMHIKLPSNM